MITHQNHRLNNLCQNQMMIVLILIIKFKPGTILLLSMTLATDLTREIFTPIYLINIIVEMSVFDKHPFVL